MKTNFLKLFAIFTVLFSVAVLADSTFAQPRRARGKVYTKAEVKQIIKRVETRLDNFVKQYDKSLDNSSLNGSNKEDWLNKRAKNLENATDELRREFDKRDLWIENKDEVRKCMNIATDIDKNMKNKRYGNTTEDNWRAVVYELNTLAKLYNVPQVGSSAY
jgi:Skp family chaperone for outer membrane proteins